MEDSPPRGIEFTGISHCMSFSWHLPNEAFR